MSTDHDECTRRLEQLEDEVRQLRVLLDETREVLRDVGTCLDGGIFNRAAWVIRGMRNG